MARLGAVTAGVALLVACGGGGDDAATTTTRKGISIPSRKGPSTSMQSTSTSMPTTTTTTPGGAATAEPLTTRSRFHFRGVGPVRAGMTVREAEQAAGVSFQISDFEVFDGHCYYARVDGLENLSFMAGSAGGNPPPTDPRDGVILRAEARGGPWRTVEGVDVGSTEDDVTAAYSGIQTEPHVYQSGGHYLTISGTGPDAGHGIRFETTPELVVEDIFSGQASAIMFVEGCA